MKIVLYVYDTDVASIALRCHELQIENVCVLLTSIPGYEETGVPSRALLSEMTSALAAEGITVDSANGATGRNPGLLTDPVANRRVIDAQLETLDVLGEAGVSTLLYYQHFPYPAVPEDVPRYWDGLYAFMTAMSDRAEAASVKIANHPVWRCLPPGPKEVALAGNVGMHDYPIFRHDGWDGPYLMSSHRDAQQLMQEVPSAANGICFCTGMHIMGADIPEMVDVFKGRIHHAQLRDVTNRWPFAEEVLPGDGQVDLPLALTRLQEAGYTGVVGPEHFGTPRWEGDDPERLSVDYLRRQLDAIASD